MKITFKGKERRDFIRLGYSSPLAFKVCKQKTVSTLLEGYTSDISQSGVLCSVKEKVKKGDLVWLSFDRSTLNICEEIEKRALIYQSGIIGRVARVKQKDKNNFDVGVRFITREEENLTHIFPKVHFMNQEAQNK